MSSGGNLEVSTPSDREILMTREFNAPRRLVFEALTQPDLIRRWLLGPPGWTMPVCEIDLQVGGSYRYVWHSEEQGVQFGFNGVFQEIVPQDRLVYTQVPNEDDFCVPALVTCVLTEAAGRTTMATTMLLDSTEARDAIIATGMADGVAISYDRLAEIVEA